MFNLPLLIGTICDHHAFGKTVRVKKLRAGSYLASPEPHQSQVNGPTFTRFGDADQIREDLAHFYRCGVLPFDGASCS